MKKPFKKNPTTLLPFALEKQLGLEKDSRFNFKFKKTKKEKKNLIKRKTTVHKSKLNSNNVHKLSNVHKIKSNVHKIKSDVHKSKRNDNVHKSTTNAEKLALLEKKNPGFAAFLNSSNLIHSQVDTEIDALRKKLKLKNGELDRNFKQDGLDYLLDGFMGSKGGDDISEDGDFGDYIENEDGEHPGEVNLSDEDDEFGLNEKNMDSDDMDLKDMDSDEDMDSDDMGSDEMNLEEFDSEDNSEDEKHHLGVEKEDTLEPKQSLYQPQSTSTTAYVPPHLRPKPTDTNTVLHRQIQGLINKLSDPNMDSIVGSIQELLLSNPRNSITTITIDIMLKLVSDHSNLLDTFCATYACFMACLNQVIGLEFGASFTQKVVEVYHQNKSGDGKISTNLAMLIAYLYSFNAISYSLIYDLLKDCIKEMKEVDVEILLKLLKIGGGRLRKDDPGALKEVVVLIQNRVGDMTGLSPRTKFMLEVITELKNNTKKKAKGVNNLIQMKNLEKVYKSVVSRRVSRVVEPPRVTLNDILSVETKGRWWLVGAAWKGNDDEVDQTIQSEQVEASELLKVCREQRMNTDIRKRIFMTVMSSEDYIDCHARLMKLGLKEKQERDIIRVLVHCCGQEEDYNPYYMFVIDLLCQNIGFKVTYQFTLWDFFKEIDEDSNEDVLESKIVNLAKLTADLIQRGSIQLSVLKTLSLTTLSPSQAIFLQTFLFKMLSKPMVKNDQGYYKPWKSLVKQKDCENLVSGLLVYMQSEIKQLIADDTSGLVSSRYKEIKRLLRDGSLSLP